jgi:hypothetical protein
VPDSQVINSVNVGGAKGSKTFPKVAKFEQMLKDPKVKVPKDFSFKKLVEDQQEWNDCYNDTLGDCTLAAVIHINMVQYAMYGKKFGYPGDTFVKDIYYKLQRKFYGTPAGSETDYTGLVNSDVLGYWKQHGLFGTKIDAFHSIDPRNHNEVRKALWIWGALFCSVSELSPSTMYYYGTDSGKDWDYDGPNYTSMTSRRKVTGGNLKVWNKYDDARGPRKELAQTGEIDYFRDEAPVDFWQGDLDTIRFNSGYRVDFSASDKTRRFQRYGNNLGHAFVAIGADDDGVEIVTWGKVVKVTWEWWDYYMGDSSFNFYKNYEQTGQVDTGDVKGGEVWVVSPTKFLDQAQLRKIDMKGNKVNGIVQWIVNNTSPWF